MASDRVDARPQDLLAREGGTGRRAPYPEIQPHESGMLDVGDGQQLHDYFTRTRAIRRGIIEAGQDTEAPDFGRSPAAGQQD